MILQPIKSNNNPPTPHTYWKGELITAIASIVGGILLGHYTDISYKHIVLICAGGFVVGSWLNIGIVTHLNGDFYKKLFQKKVPQANLPQVTAEIPRNLL